nr:MAG TPA: hypothetical protein [Bacteriophage sp.]
MTLIIIIWILIKFQKKQLHRNRLILLHRILILMMFLFRLKIKQ